MMTMSKKLQIPEEKYYIDRRTGEKHEEPLYCEATLRFLYGSSKIGKPLGELLAKFSVFSRLIGWWYRRSWTRKRIGPFIVSQKIDMTDFEKPVESYPSFDAFFIRSLKKGSRPLANGMIIPADGRYLFYQDLSVCDQFTMKGNTFSLKKLIGNDSLAHHYIHGSMVVARLAPGDYHRLHFPCDCTPGPSRLINGLAYPVHPAAVIQNMIVLTENKRMITELKTDHHGTILFIEIGATAVSSIHQTYQPGKDYKKGEEKGYFSFGGSSLILLFEKGSIRLASDVLSHSVQHIETLCLMGQPLEEPM
jgi:phosphatidylserine decarboxylase